MFRLPGDDRRMNSYRLPARRPAPGPVDPSGYVTRRLASLLVVVGAIGGVVVASLLDGAWLPIPFALAIGLVLFVGAAALASSVAARDTITASLVKAASVKAARWPSGGGESSQLGPDQEQVLGRKTGARI